jgi:subtilisin-like proprotein convertase family protein
MSKLKLYLLTGFLAAALVPLAGCGSECGPGTAEQDGQCVLVAKGCGDGTTLSNKQCIVDTSGCGAGTVLEGEQCVPGEDACTGGSIFDQALRVCVPSTEIVCGENTEANDEQICVPSSDACGTMTVRNDEGRCVIDAASCGAGTTLDASTGGCVLGEAACGSGLGFDTDTSTCVPTDELCDAGTAFDPASRLCLPDGCAEGDMLVNGVCMDPLEQDAHNADLTETENNDPALGGTAETLTVNPVDGAAFSFAGSIGAPTDLDADSTLDQDVDVFEFAATQGDWLQVGVQSVGLPAPAFVVRGPDGYMRWSEINLAPQTARHIVIPADGTYTVTVLPSLTLQNPDVGPSGGEDWGYVGTLEAINAPSATDQNVSAGAAQLTGEFTDLSDNLFTVSGVTGDDVVTFTVDSAGEHAEGVLQVWDATTLVRSESIGAGDEIDVGVPASGNATVLVDWTKVYGVTQDFAVSAEITGEQRQVTVPANTTVSETVTLSQFDQLVASQRNPAGDDLDLVVLDPSDTELSAQTLAPGAELGQVVFTDGDYTVEVTNNTSSDVTASLYIHVVPPVDLGDIGSNSSTTSPAATLTNGGALYYLFTGSADDVLSFSHDNDQGEEIDYVVYDAGGNEVDSSTGIDARSDVSGFGVNDVIWSLLPSDVTYLVEVAATTNLSNQTLDVRSQTPTVAGQLDFQSTVSVNNTAGLDAGYSEFHLVEVTSPTTFYGSVSPGNGESIGFTMYDASLGVVSSESGSGDLSLGGAIDAAGTYLVQVAADETISTYDLSLNGIVDEENLGDLAVVSPASSSTLPVFNRDQTMTLNFSVPAGHVIEISHVNAEGEDHEGYLYDENGDQLRSDAFYYPTNDSDPDYMYWYSQNGGDFEFVLEGWSTTTDQVIDVRAFEPGDFGQISGASSPAMNVAEAVSSGQSYFQFLEFTEPVNLAGTLSPTNAESLDFGLHDLENTSVISESGSGGDVSFDGVIDDAGTYLVRVDANEAATGFDLTINATANSEDLGALSAGASFTSPTMADFGGSKQYSLNFSVPAGHVIELSHVNAEAEDHEGYLYDGTGEVLTDDLFWEPTNHADPEYIYWYSHGGGTFEFVLDGYSTTTNQELTLRVIAPEDMGQFDVASPSSVTETDSKVFGQAYFKRIEFAQPLRYDATLSPTAAEDLNLTIQDTDNTDVLSQDGTGGDVTLTGESMVTAGTYVVRVDADEAATGFQLTFDNATSIEESLGAIGSGSSQTSSTLATFNDGDSQVYTFDVPAAQVIEISHANMEGTEQDLTLYGANGEELLDAGSVYPTSNASPDYTYWYADTAGSYSVVLEAGADVTDQTLTVNLSTPTDLGTLPVDQVSSHVNTAGLSVGRSDVYLVNLDSGSRMGIETIVPSAEDTDVYVYDLAMNEVASDISTSTADLSDVLISAGTYLVEVSAIEAVASYDLDITVGTELVVRTPNLTIPDGSNGSGTTVTDTATVSGSCAAIDAVAIYVDISHLYRSDLVVDLVSPAGTRVTLHNFSGGFNTDIVGWYPTDLTVDGPGALADFSNEAADGGWTLELADHYAIGEGTLNFWALELTCL